jgi:hypothetical protein
MEIDSSDKRIYIQRLARLAGTYINISELKFSVDGNRYRYRYRYGYLSLSEEKDEDLKELKRNKI